MGPVLNHGVETHWSASAWPKACGRNTRETEGHVALATKRGPKACGPSNMGGPETCGFNNKENERHVALAIGRFRSMWI